MKNFERKGMTTIVRYPERGEGGKSSYRGNCSPKLIEDLINQFQIKQLSDFMCGSGSVNSVCQRMGVEGTYLDLRLGFDMMTDDIPERPENIFWHPPYDSIIKYAGYMYSAEEVINKYGFDPRVNDLSQCKNWDEFVKKMNYCLMKQYTALEKGGRLYMLMGDIKKRGTLYSMLASTIKPGVLEQIIIKEQYNCVSDRKTYNGNFIPIVHEYLMILRKDNSLFFDVSLPQTKHFDIRNSKNATWRDIVAAILEENGQPMNLEEIYAEMEGHARTLVNLHWKEKIRQTLRSYTSIFRVVSRGCYALY